MSITSLYILKEHICLHYIFRKNRICSSWEKILSFQSRFILKRGFECKSCLPCRTRRNIYIIDGIGSQVLTTLTLTLRNHAYSNILKILPPKTESFQIKILIFSYNCSKHRGNSNEYPQSMILSRNKKIIYTPLNPTNNA